MDSEITVRKLLSFWFSLMMGCVILVGAEKLGWSQVVWSLSEPLTVPVKQVIWDRYDGVREWVSWWQYWRAGQEELARLKVNLSDRAVLTVEVVLLREENEQMRRLLGADFPSNDPKLPV